VSKLQVVQGGTLLLAARVYTIILPHHLLLEYFRRVSIKSTWVSTILLQQYRWRPSLSRAVLPKWPFPHQILRSVHVFVLKIVQVRLPLITDDLTHQMDEEKELTFPQVKQRIGMIILPNDSTTEFCEWKTGEVIRPN